MYTMQQPAAEKNISVFFQPLDPQPLVSQMNEIRAQLFGNNSSTQSREILSWQGWYDLNPAQLSPESLQCYIRLLTWVAGENGRMSETQITILTQQFQLIKAADTFGPDQANKTITSGINYAKTNDFTQDTFEKIMVDYQKAMIDLGVEASHLARPLTAVLYNCILVAYAAGTGYSAKAQSSVKALAAALNLDDKRLEQLQQAAYLDIQLMQIQQQGQASQELLNNITQQITNLHQATCKLTLKAPGQHWQIHNYCRS